MYYVNDNDRLVSVRSLNCLVNFMCMKLMKDLILSDRRINVVIKIGRHSYFLFDRLGLRAQCYYFYDVLRGEFFSLLRHHIFIMKL
jgi:hypothetical protein